MEERIRARLADLTQAREQYATEASRQLMGFDAAIGELSQLLEPPKDRPLDPQPEESVSAVRDTP
jgi:hypothetical protein